MTYSRKGCVSLVTLILLAHKDVTIHCQGIDLLMGRLVINLRD